MKYKVNFKNIFYDENINSKPEYKEYAESIIKRFPYADVIPVKSHTRVGQVWDSDPKKWFKTKDENLILGIKKSLKNEPNQNSSDFIAPSNVNGCLASCQYCYVARHKGGGNPATVFVNIHEIADEMISHSEKLGPKTIPNQQDDKYWTYDIGCNSDCSIDMLYSDNAAVMIDAANKSNFAKTTFATKYVNHDAWLKVDPTRSRIRYSIMPQPISKRIDIRTSPIGDRVRSIETLVRHGHEVHLNFSPVVLYPEWIEDWTEMMKGIDFLLPNFVKDQLKCEVIFLTHHAGLHEKNMNWNSVGEDYLWAPSIQEVKGRDVLRYQIPLKRKAMNRFENMIKTYMPYCDIRYIF